MRLRVCTAFRVEVRQRFENPGDQWVEALYAFPLPENAAVDRLRMEIGERVIVGEIREKADAQKLYEQARSKGRRASVVHQQRPNLFRSAVANIGSRESIDVTIAYADRRSACRPLQPALSADDHASLHSGRHDE